jgi:hypothetical protein
MKRLPERQFMNMCLHVDDFFVIASSVALLDKLHQELEMEYGTVSNKRGNMLEYLGMKVEIDDDGNIKLSQPLYSDRIVKEFLSQDDIEQSSKVSTPRSSIGLSNKDDDNDLLDQTYYLRIVGSFNFLAQFTRPDLLYCMSMAAQQCARPNKRSIREIRRILLYVANTIHYGIIFSPGPILISVYADAAHNSYPDGRGHYGYCCSLGIRDGTFFAVSKRMKLTTLSSTESEYVALCEAARELVWLRSLLTELGWEQTEPSVIWQDNQSTLQMVDGHRNHQASKHINVKYHYTGEQVQLGNIELVYCPTEEMVADILTKPLGRESHVFFTGELLNSN